MFPYKITLSAQQYTVCCTYYAVAFAVCDVVPPPQAG